MLLAPQLLHILILDYYLYFTTLKEKLKLLLHITVEFPFDIKEYLL